MTWEETIQFIRTQPEYKELVEMAYFEEYLPLNVERFLKSDEFIETMALLSKYKTLNSDTKLLDIGSGNGISALAFALNGMNVDAVEPDPSETIGAGAIRKLKEHYHLNNLTIYEGFAEELKFPDSSYDIVYTRQCMHHAHDLKQFLLECSRVLRKNGVLITVRDHIVHNEIDKKYFLENHPLQKFYGGENAFSEAEYKAAITNAGLNIKEMLKHFDSVINYFPLKRNEKEEKENKNKEFAKSIINRKIPFFNRIPFINNIAETYIQKKLGNPFDENKVPGRMYTFLAIK